MPVPQSQQQSSSAWKADCCTTPCRAVPCTVLLFYAILPFCRCDTGAPGQPVRCPHQPQGEVAAAAARLGRAERREHLLSAAPLFMKAALALGPPPLRACGDLLRSGKWRGVSGYAERWRRSEPAAAGLMVLMAGRWQGGCTACSELCCAVKLL